MTQMKFKTTLALITLAVAFGLAACGGSSAPKDSGILPCATVDDCPGGWVCQDGLCMESVPECVFDVDCDTGEQCVDGTCQQIQSDGGTDGGDGGGDVDQDTPAIEVDPTFIDFGNGRIGDTVVQELTLSNAGTADLTIFSLTMEAGTSDEFSAEPLGNLNQVLAPAGQLTVTVRYSPVDGSVDEGALLIACDDPDDALVRVELTSSYKGTSEVTVADDPAGDLAEVELIDFGQAQVGAASVVTVYVLNTGTGNAVLTVDEVRTQPVSSEYFQLDVNPAPPAFLNPYVGACGLDEDCGEGNTCSSGVCLDANGAVVDAVAVEVTFTPTQVGSFQESLVINSDEGAGEGDETIRILTLRGEGIQPALSVTPNPIDFGHWYVGQASNLTISLRNDGGQALNIDAIGLEDGSGPFSLDAGGPGPWLLDPGQQLQLSADYAPGAPGSHADVLRIDSDDPDSPTRVDVYGSASQPPTIAVDPAALDFGEVQLGQVVQLAFQVRNDGGSPLLIDSLGLIGGAGEFSLLQQALPAIAPGDSAQVDVAYAPAGAIGADADLIRLTSNDPLTPEVLVDLSGIGTDPVLELSPASIDFGPIYQGFTAGPQLLTVRNAGFGGLQINAIGLAVGANPDYALQNLPALPAVLGPGQSLQAEIYFTPSGSGIRTAAIEVASSDVDLPLASAQVTGSGTDCPEGFWDIDGDPGNGCEYPCDLTNGGVEDCDGQDNDCDAATDEDLTTRACQQANQYGTCTGSETCDGANGWVGCDAAVPEQEVCDGDDDDCDGAVDADDNDLQIAPCELQQGVCNGTDHRAALCQAGVWQPCLAIDYGADYGAEECDGLDNDCDGQADGADADLVLVACENQQGVCNGAMKSAGHCAAGSWSACGPADYQAHDPDYSLDDTCDGLDNNCNGLTDAADAGLIRAPCEDQDGVCAGSIHRASLCVLGAWEACDFNDYGAGYGNEICDDLDNDCDGATDVADADLLIPPCEIQQGVCNGSTKPLALCQGGAWGACGPGEYGAYSPDYGAEICDGHDNDCNGQTDSGDAGMQLADCELTQGVCTGDTHRAALCVSGSWQPCDAADYGAGYGAEVCDGLDNDCDGQADGADGDLVVPLCENQSGVCNGSTKPVALCQGGGGWDVCGPSEYGDHSAYYGAEVCDGRDNDCDSFLDSADGDLVQVLCEDQDGECAGAVHRPSLCSGGTWSACEATDYINNSAYYGAEVCDGRDNNCDTQADEGLTTRPCSQSNVWGTCNGTETCDGLNGWITCTAAVPAEEVCDGVDNDCDTATDGDDPGLAVTLCELQAGVCAGSVHHPSQCNGVGWDLCTSADYEAHDPVFGVEVCGNGQDEDCSGAANDKDVDADGAFDDACAGGTDCDDNDPNSYPGAPEIQDAADNDCNNLVDEGLIPAGAVIVTEIMKDPDGVLDSVGEYFEVTNDWVNPVNLHSWTVSDAGINVFTVSKPEGIVIGPGESAVFCINADSLVNGGVSCDFDFDNFQLGNSDDEIILTLDGFEIDRVEYDAGATFPDPTGESLSLDPAAYDFTDNDDGSNWCATPLDAAYELDSGDHGTPGQFNPSCSGALALLDVEPDSGIEFGGETITLIGAGFTGLNAVTVGGVACASFTVVSDSEVSCLTPALAPGDHDVIVTKGPNSETLVAGYRTTGEEGAPGIGWCVIQWPTSTTTSAGVPTELVFGRAYKAGVTEPAGPPAGITAAIGFGPTGSDPRTTPGWTWLPGVWNPSCPDCGNDDEFMQSIITDFAGSYSYAVRFSEDGGYHFTFCDLPPGTTDGFSAGNLGALTVTP